MMKNIVRKSCGIFLVVGLVLSAGCTSRGVGPEHRPRLAIAQNSDGWVTINMNTRVGYEYCIMYIDLKTKVWTPLEGCDAIRGTGEVVQVRKHFNPRVEVPPLTVDYVKMF